MSNFIGRQEDFAVIKESTRGTSVNPTRLVKKSDFDFDDKIETISDEIGLGVIEDADDSEVVKQWSEGNVKSKVLDITIGDILLGTFGSVVTTVKETTAKQHVFSVLQSSQHPSFTVMVRNPNRQSLYTNCVVKEFSLDVALKDFVKFSVGYIGKKGNTGTATPAYVNENHFASKDVKVFYAPDLATLGSAPVELKMSSVSLKITKQIQEDEILGALEPQDFYNKQFVVEGDIELNYDTETLRNLAIASTPKAFRIQLLNTGVTIGASSNPTLTFDFAKVKFTEFSKNGGLNDIMKQKLHFKSFYSITDSKSIIATLINTNASY